MATATKPELKQVRLELTPELHHRFRIAAAVENTSMMALVLRLVTEYLDSRQEVTAEQKEGRK
jgi:hypothetical protein